MRDFVKRIVDLEKINNGNSMNKLDISIIIPCHNEEKNIPVLYAELVKILNSTGNSFELLFINDGSSDNTQGVIETLHRDDSRVKLISFATNYGHQVALMQGLKGCSGSIAITMDADLQHPPAYILEMVQKQLDSNALIVEAKRFGRQKGFLKNIFSSLFYTCFNMLTGVKLEPGVSDFRLYTRLAIDALCETKEITPFLRGMISDMRIPRVYVDYELGERYAGTPSYTIKKSAMMAYNSLMSYSKLPYRLGILVATLFIIYAFFTSVTYFYNRIFTNNYIAGNTDIVILMCGGFGIILFICAIILRQLGVLVALSKGKATVIISKKL